MENRSILNSQIWSYVCLQEKTSTSMHLLFTQQKTQHFFQIASCASWPRSTYKQLYYYSLDCNP